MTRAKIGFPGMFSEAWAVEGIRLGQSMKTSTYILSIKRSIQFYFLAMVSLHAEGQLLWDKLSISNSLPLTAVSMKSDFSFMNGGNEPTRILNVFSDCGCVVAEAPKGEIPPGGLGKIAIEMDVKERTGLLERSVRVVTDRGASTLKLVAEVPKIVTLEPGGLTFSRTNVVEKSVILSNVLGSPIKITAVTYDCEERVECRLEELVAGKLFRLNIKPPSLKHSFVAVFKIYVELRKPRVRKFYRLEAVVE
jgi:hypothetical protein